MKTIKTPVADDIRQLVISPNSTFLAIPTTHTIHICILPDPSLLKTNQEAFTSHETCHDRGGGWKTQVFKKFDNASCFRIIYYRDCILVNEDMSRH